VTDHRARLALEPGEPSHDGRIVGVAAVPVELHEILEQERDEVERVGPRRVSGDKGLLPGGERSVDVVRDADELLLELGNVPVVLAIAAGLFEVVDLAADL
jgi:hypothetical protein